MFKAVVISLVAGGLATSTAEFFMKYNLIDFLKDKIMTLLHLSKAVS
jgi:hypothetical protein